MKELLDKLLKITKIDSVEARWIINWWTLYAKANWRMYRIFLEDELMPLTSICDKMSSREEAVKFLINAVIESGKSAVIDEFQNYGLGTCKKMDCNAKGF